MGKKNKYNNGGDVFSSNSGNIVNRSSAGRDIIITDNRKYNYTTVYNIISSIPDKDDNYRSMLSGIEHETESPIHFFTGFINHIDLNMKNVVICNIFWNRDVYICNHINVRLGKYMFKNIDFNNLDNVHVNEKDVLLSLPGNVEDLKVGDFILFKGLIYTYGYKNKEGKFNKGIRLEEVIDVVRGCEVIIPYKIPVYDKSKYGDVVIDEMSFELIQRYYDIQINRIRFSLEPTKYYNVQMYEAILQHIMHKGEKEHDMIKNQLRLNEEEFNDELIIGVSLLRYLVTEFDLTHSPYTVFTYMNVLMKPYSKIKNPIYEKAVRRYSEKALSLKNTDILMWITLQAQNALNHYMREFTDIVTKGGSNLFIERKNFDE